MIHAVDDTMDTQGRGAELRPDEPDTLRVVLVVNAGDEAQIVDFGTRLALTVGRDGGADVRLFDRSLSRRHARFERRGENVRVVDLGSRHGTLIAGKRVDDAEMRAGDTAVLGNVIVSIHVITSPRTASLGLCTSGQMRARIEGEWARASGFRRPFAVVLLRATSEITASTFAGVCVTKLRSSDCAGLYDPHSLLLLLPETDAAGADSLVRELALAAADSVTLVSGIAAYPESALAPDQLVSAAIAAAAQTSPLEPVVIARSPTVRASEVDSLIRRSTAMLAVDRLIDRFAARIAPVLVLGETGTGKELVARELHRRSPRQARPLKVVNCAAIPDSLVESVLFGHVRGAFTGADRAQTGVFEQAKGGSIFLDEVGELSLSAQAALLRTVETRRICPVGGSREIEVDVRVISATHRQLEKMVESGRFRLDLYHRLNTLTLELPPLRNRPEEIAPLAEAFVRRLGPESEAGVRSIAPDAIALLERYTWPGNIRELKNVIERALALAESDEVTIAELPNHIRDAFERTADTVTFSPAPPAIFPDGGIDLRAYVHEHEAVLIRRALERANGRQRKAAELLNLPLRTLERKLRGLGVRSPNGM